MEPGIISRLESGSYRWNKAFGKNRWIESGEQEKHLIEMHKSIWNTRKHRTRGPVFHVLKLQGMPRETKLLLRRSISFVSDWKVHFQRTQVHSERIIAYKRNHACMVKTEFSELFL